MPTTIIRNSGNVPHSTFRINVNSSTFIVTRISPAQGDTITYSQDEYGVEGAAGYVQFTGLKRGSLELQPVNTSSVINAGDLVIIPANNGSGSAFSASIFNPVINKSAGQVWSVSAEYVELSQGNS